MAAGNKKRRMMGEINVVPYIDVMLVLLVIFMVTAPMLSQGVKVDLPQADSTPIPQDDREPLVVSVNAAGDYFLSLGGDAKRPLATDELLKQMQTVLAAQSGLAVYIKGDRNVPYGKVVELLVLIRDEVPSVGLMTEPPEGDNDK